MSSKSFLKIRHHRVLSRLLAAVIIGETGGGPAFNDTSYGAGG